MYSALTPAARACPTIAARLPPSEWSRCQMNIARPPGFIPANRYYITPYMTLGQYAHNTAVLGQAYSQVPPYMLGYNPYPQVINYGPLYRLYSPAYSNPYAGLGYSYLYSGYNFNPLLYSSYYSPYSSYYPYSSLSTGGY